MWFALLGTARAVAWPVMAPSRRRPDDVSMHDALHWLGETVREMDQAFGLIMAMVPAFAPNVPVRSAINDVFATRCCKSFARHVVAFAAKLPVSLHVERCVTPQ